MILNFLHNPQQHTLIKQIYSFNIETAMGIDIQAQIKSDSAYVKAVKEYVSLSNLGAGFSEIS